MYYSAFDLQTKEYLHTGRNSTSKKECVDDVFDFIVSGWTFESDEEAEDCEKKFLKMTVDEKESFLSIDEIIIESHEDKISDMRWINYV